MTETWKIYRALDLISRIKKEETHEKYIDRHNAFDIAIESMEKQMPKKPIEQFRFGGFGANDKGGKCPICGRWINNGRHWMYCECGQKLDWEEGGTSD